METEERKKVGRNVKILNLIFLHCHLSFSFSSTVKTYSQRGPYRLLFTFREGGEKDKSWCRAVEAVDLVLRVALKW